MGSGKVSGEIFHLCGLRQPGIEERGCIGTGRAAQGDDTGVRPTLAHAASDILAADVGQAEVEEYQHGLELEFTSDCLGAIAGVGDVMAIELEQQTERFAGVDVIVDHENPTSVGAALLAH